ncbi:MAG: cysteine rich repeat-containing protein [Smithella sp.]
MKMMIRSMFAISLVLFFVGSALAQEKVVRTVTEGCKNEINTYCKNVTPGEGRLLACLYAYGDKLSGRCEYALYDASVQLERAVNALNYVANECRDDLKTYCSAVRPGEGRLLDCIEKNKKKVSSRCTQAVKDVGLKKK